MINKLKKILFTLIGCLMIGTAMSDDVPAFPGAEGYGAKTKGGRGGDVYIVTKLSDDGSKGTLRYGLNNMTGPRTIVFEVGGIIHLQSRLKARKNFLTIAGQTAPGGGITLAGYPIDIVAKKDSNGNVPMMNDVVIRYMRFRCGDFNGRDRSANTKRCLPFIKGRGNNNLGGDGGDCIYAQKIDKLILDHVSASWGMDETVDIADCKNVTVQYSIISEGLLNSYHSKGHHSRGFLSIGGTKVSELNTGVGGYTLAYNLISHNNMRNPLAGAVYKPDIGDPNNPNAIFQRFDFVNNVVYNWGERSGHTGRSNVMMNYINNYLVAGPSTDIDMQYSACKNNLGRDKNLNVAMREEGGGDEGTFLLYHSGNFMDTDKDALHDGVLVGDSAFAGFEPGEILNKAYPLTVENIVSASRAYDKVLDNAGASDKRDDIDKRLINDVKTRTGKIIDSQDEVGGLVSIANGTPPADVDRDGMADSWEVLHFGNTNRSSASNSNSDYDNDGYTDLEEYLNGTDPKRSESITPNLAPVITSVVANPSPVIDANMTTLKVLASDADNGPQVLSYTWSKQSGPGNLAFSKNNSATADTTNATFSTSGSYVIKVIVSDGIAQAERVLSLQVTLPVVTNVITINSQSPQKNININEGEKQLFSINAQGSNAATLSYQWLINGALVSDNHSTSYQFNSDANSVGIHVVKVIISIENGDDASYSWNLSIIKGNKPPVINQVNPIGLVTLISGNSKIFQVSATDDNGDSLNYKWSLDDTLLSESGNAYKYSPTISSIGSHVLTVNVNDGNRGSALHSWSISVTEPSENTFSLKVNFQPKNATVPNGYLVDSGYVFGDRKNGYRYGWSQGNFDVRDRDQSHSADQRYDTLIHMWNNDVFWQAEVPNGEYKIKLVAGDPDYYNSHRYRLEAEGALVLSGNPNSNHRWIESIANITVTDGRLTIKNGFDANASRICFIDITSTTIAENTNTVYEDGASGNTANWVIYDASPSGAVINNTFDADRNSNVIQLLGDGTKNGFRLLKDGSNKWHNTNDIVIGWSVKYSESFVVYLDVETSKGHRYVTYRPGSGSPSQASGSKYIMHYLGSNLINGQWHDFARDLEADIKALEPENELIEINSFLIRGAGLIDDVFTTQTVINDTINFNDVIVDGYGGSQDKGLPTEIEDRGKTIKVSGNSWKKIDFAYDITANTILEFDFKSTSMGEIHGIGLGSDVNINGQKTFQLYGTQAWGIANFSNYDTYAPEWQHYKIKVGDFYIGVAINIFFANDNDSNGSISNSYFRNLKIYEE